LVALDLQQNKPLTANEVRFALALMRRAEYRRYRVCVRNVTDNRATGVSINPSAGYSLAPGFREGTFTLRRHEESLRDYVTAIGYQEGQPRATTDFAGQTDGDAKTTPPSQGSEQKPAQRSCVEKPGATEATYFTVDWQDNPARPSTQTVLLLVGVPTLGIVVLLLFGRIKEES
jgi:hypothetical protein